VPKVSVVEAATLAGRPPAEIRVLIQRGELAAEAVALANGTAYLIDTSALTELGVEPSTVADPAGPVRLRAALAGLRAALARRQGPPAAEDEGEPAPPRSSRPSPRPLGGLGPGDLEALTGQIERLLGP
jgi:hypothetical protein